MRHFACWMWIVISTAAVSVLAEQPQLPKNVLYYGHEEQLPEFVPLQAGPLRMIFEAGDLRYIKLGDQEVVRRWYAVTRDRNWGTLENRLSNVEMDVRDDSFHIRYDVENKQGEIDFVWTGDITGEPDGTITFLFDGQARSTFLRNRIGFCILHSSREAPGARCRAVHADGSVVESKFPRFIAPDNPFQELTGFAHEVMPDVWAELEFEGDLFEMEDQRNWVDASFKTFCTPLSLPFPVEVPQGTKISQRVTMRLQGDVPADVSTGEEEELTFRLVSEEGSGDQQVPRLPAIGLGISSSQQSLTPRQIQRLGAIQLGHLRVDLTLAEPDHTDLLREAARQATALDATLEVALHLSDDAQQELSQFAQWIADVRPPVCRWLVFHRKEHSTTEPWLNLARQFLRDFDPEIPIVGGTDANFTELNRGRPPLPAVDAVCYSINPQVHAYDNRSLVETLEAHRATIESARQFIEDKPLAITPITLKQRFNPVATAPEPPPAPGELPSQVDVRQMSLFGAGWTLGSLKYVAESGDVDSVTYYETVGWRGVMESDDGSPVPEKFRSLPGSVFPMYHVFADVGEMSGGKVLASQSNDTLQVDGLVIERDGRRRWLIANLTSDPQTVELRGLRGPVVVRRINETNVIPAMTDPEEFRAERGEPLDTKGGVANLSLMPFEVCRLDEPGGD